MTLNDFVRDMSLRARVYDELARTYEDSDRPRPLMDDVITKAITTVIEDIRYRASDQASCNKVDECTATAFVLYRLAEWMEEDR